MGLAVSHSANCFLNFRASTKHLTAKPNKQSANPALTPLQIVQRALMLFQSKVLFSRAVCTWTCTVVSSSRCFYHGFMKPDLRISIKDYRRDKDLKLMMLRASSGIHLPPPQAISENHLPATALSDGARWFMGCRQ
jgi:hypothetical protein